jgi:hypothetical protein
MDVFALRNRVVEDYKKYIESFVRIRDGRIENFVREEFASGVLWPDPILQLNPAYQPGRTLDELAAKGVLRHSVLKAILFGSRDFDRHADTNLQCKLVLVIHLLVDGGPFR